jgi:hypothetical protein
MRTVMYHHPSSVERLFLAILAFSLLSSNSKRATVI